MPRAFNDSERERIRGRLIATGKRCINAGGLKLVTIDEVAREAGISKGSFYAFYPSREDFILSVFESWEEEYRSRLFSEFSEGQGSLRSRLERFILGSFELLEREPGLAKIGSRDLQLLMEKLPPERVAAHQAADGRAIEEAVAPLLGLGGAPLAERFHGVAMAIFVIAMHREDFPPESYDETVRFIAAALAAKLAQEAEPASTGDILRDGEKE